MVRYKWVVPALFLILMARPFQWYHPRQNWIFFFLCMRNHEIGLYLVKGCMHTYIFFGPHGNILPTISLLTKSRTNIWICSLVYPWGHYFFCFLILLYFELKSLSHIMWHDIVEGGNINHMICFLRFRKIKDAMCLLSETNLQKTIIDKYLYK